MPVRSSAVRRLRSHPAVPRVADALGDRVLSRLAVVRPVRLALLRATADALGDGRLGPEPARLRIVLLSGADRFAYRVDITATAARIRPALTAASPDELEVELALADAVRIGLGQLDPGDALLERRLEVRGDFGLALRLTEAFSCRES